MHNNHSAGECLLDPPLPLPSSVLLPSVGPTPPPGFMVGEGPGPVKQQQGL